MAFSVWSDCYSSLDLHRLSGIAHIQLKIDTESLADLQDSVFNSLQPESFCPEVIRYSPGSGRAVYSSRWYRFGSRERRSF